MKSAVMTEIPLGTPVSITGCSGFTFLNDRLKPRGPSAVRVPVLMLLFRELNIILKALVRHYHTDTGTIARAVKKPKDAGISGESSTLQTAGQSASFSREKIKKGSSGQCRVLTEDSRLICRKPGDFPRADE